MKHIITALLLALAVGVGLLLPEVSMQLQDRSLQAPQTLEIREYSLDYHPGLSQEAAETEKNKSEVFALRLAYFESGPAVTVPLSSVDSVQQGWAIQLGTAFLTQACDVPLEVTFSHADYQLAWFEDGNTFPFWTVYIEFNGSWVCIMTIDAETEGILQFILSPNGADLAELFPNSFHKAANEADSYFEELVSQQICEAITHRMESVNMSTCQFSPGEDSGTALFSFYDDLGLMTEVFFVVDVAEGINFNNPAQY